MFLFFFSNNFHFVCSWHGHLQCRVITLAAYTCIRQTHYDSAFMVQFPNPNVRRWKSYNFFFNIPLLKPSNSYSFLPSSCFLIWYLLCTICTIALFSKLLLLTRTNRWIALTKFVTHSPRFSVSTNCSHLFIYLNFIYFNIFLALKFIINKKKPQYCIYCSLTLKLSFDFYLFLHRLEINTVSSLLSEITIVL